MQAREGAAAPEDAYTEGLDFVFIILEQLFS